MEAGCTPKLESWRCSLKMMGFEMSMVSGVMRKIDRELLSSIRGSLSSPVASRSTGGDEEKEVEDGWSDAS